MPGAADRVTRFDADLFESAAAEGAAGAGRLNSSSITGLGLGARCRRNTPLRGAESRLRWPAISNCAN